MITALTIVLCGFLTVQTYIQRKQIQWLRETITTDDDIIERYKKLTDEQDETIRLWKDCAEKQEAKTKRETMRADGIPLMVQVNTSDFCSN